MEVGLVGSLCIAGLEALPALPALPLLPPLLPPRLIMGCGFGVVAVWSISKFQETVALGF